MGRPDGSKIAALFEKMEYNDELPIDIESALNIWIEEQEKKLKSKPDFHKKGLYNYETLAKNLHYLACIIEKDRQFFEKAPNVAIQSTIDVFIEYCKHYANIILQDKLWKCLDIDVFNHKSWNSFESMWYTLSLIIGNNKRIFEYLYTDSGLKQVIVGSPIQNIDTAMIILMDADLDSVIDSLTTKLRYLKCRYNIKIWIHEPIKKKFANLLDERYSKKCSNPEEMRLKKLEVSGFRGKEEAIREVNSLAQIKAVSIWTQDVIAAKNLAAAINVFIIWINTHEQLGAGLILPLATPSQWTLDPCAATSDAPKLIHCTEIDGKKIDLFYGSSWKEPMNDMYWIDENGLAQADATKEDIEDCVKSACQGFKTWRSVTLTRREKLLKNLSDRIRSNGDASLANSILEWISFPTLFGHSLTYIRDGEIEISTSRIPKGVIVIARNERIDLFQRLISACVAGNSVIIISGQGFSGIAEYLDMFAACEFPPGVINSLTFSDLFLSLRLISKINLVSVFCTNYKDEEQVECSSKGDMFHNERVYMKYTWPKSVWLPCK